MKELTVKSSICLLCCILMLSFAGKATAHIQEGVAKKKTSDTLEAFYNWMMLSEEGDYGKIMQARKHPVGRLAPEFLRDYVVMMNPQRIYYSQGVDVNDGLVTFWWNFDEFAVKTSIDSFVLETEQFLSEQSYEKKSNTTQPGVKIYELVIGSRVCTFIMGDTIKPSGGKLCSGKLRFEIKLVSSILPPSAATIVKLYPAIECLDFPPGIFNVFKKLSFERIEYGGTWSRYYYWDIKIPFSDEDALTVLRKTLIEAILDYGFVFTNEQDHITVFKLQFAETASYIYLSKPDPLVIRMRFQANS